MHFSLREINRNFLYRTEKQYLNILIDLVAGTKSTCKSHYAHTFYRVVSFFRHVLIIIKYDHESIHNCL